MVGPQHSANAAPRRPNTECFVHSLLESQKKHGGSYRGALDGIAETLATKRIGSAADKIRTDEDSLVESKGGDQADEPGSRQEDQLSWTQQAEAQRLEKGDADLRSGEDPNATHSRLLTKRQLSDMAWGVRELAKRLGSIRLKLKVRTVFLLTKAHDESLIENTRDMVKWLLSPEREVRYTVWVEDNLRNNRKFDAPAIVEEMREHYESHREDQANVEKRLRYWTNDLCKARPHTFDFVVTLGGDGTVLYASWLFQRVVPPVLSFALGSLGFLTKFDYDDFPEILTKAFRDGVTISLRLRFEGTVMRSQKRRRTGLENGERREGEEEDGDMEMTRDLVEELVGEEKEDDRTHRPDGTYAILNDIVVDRGPNPSKSVRDIQNSPR